MEEDLQFLEAKIDGNQSSPANQARFVLQAMRKILSRKNWGNDVVNNYLSVGWLQESVGRNWEGDDFGSKTHESNPFDTELGLI